MHHRHGGEEQEPLGEDEREQLSVRHRREDDERIQPESFPCPRERTTPARPRSATSTQIVVQQSLGATNIHGAKGAFASGMTPRMLLLSRAAAASSFLL